MDQASSIVSSLIKRFERNREVYKNKKYYEMQVAGLISLSTGWAITVTT